MNLDALIAAVVNLKSRIEVIPSFVWGTIKSIDPLTVLLDGEDSPLRADACFGLCKSEVRVLCILLSRRLYAFSAAPLKTSDLLDPNPTTIRINGKQYPAYGSATVQIGSWAHSWPNIYVQTIHVPFPCDLPSGWTFETFALQSSSYTTVQTGSLNYVDRRMNCRVIQFGSNDLNALSRVGWRLVKE